MKNITLSIFAIILTCCSSCGSKGDNNVTPDPTPDTTVVVTTGAKVYTTTADKSQLFKETTVPYGKTASMSPYAVKLVRDKEYQRMDGFGFALTQASCYNLLKMSQTDRTKFLKEMFSQKEGMGSSLIRVCIGGSDFSMDEFTYCDTKGIENFAVNDLDTKYLFPVLKEIFAINPDVKIIGSPWSCPRWMKRSVNNDSDYYSWTSGRLKPEYYRDYALYFADWIKAFQDKGFPIYAITPQNEPLNKGNSMSLYMPADEERDFIKNGLGPVLKGAGLNTKIICYDHNYDVTDYTETILKDADAAAYVAGSGWHNYGGSVTALDKIVSEFHDKEIYFTEASIGSWNYSFDGCLINDMRDIFLATISRMCRGITYWNLMLDENGKPYRPGGCSTCYGGVQISSSDYSYSNIVRNSQYYQVAHCSKVIKPDAIRIGTSGYTKGGITYQAFLNTDGSYGVVILNENSASQQLVFISSAHSVTCTVPAKAIVSLAWSDD